MQIAICLFSQHNCHSERSEESQSIFKVLFAFLKKAE
jgi:hypothetical protein